ncbi:ATP-dependent RNA helicase DDX54-like, partial [Diaphorina citri]|uniref:RNA helicase n=1 Tax=Diaphorina citri TaxID=121845 RepID=A0A3Q0JH38_DIACI
MPYNFLGHGLFEMGFGEQLTEIINRLPDARQTLLFSATLPKVLVQFARAGLSDPVLIRLDVENKIPDTLQLGYFSCRPDEKEAALLCLLKHVIPENAMTVVFTATKYHVEYVHKILGLAGISSTYIYSDLDPQRWKDKNKISDDADDEEKISMLSNIPQRFRQNRTLSKTAALMRHKRKLHEPIISGFKKKREEFILAKKADANENQKEDSGSRVGLESSNVDDIESTFGQNVVHMSKKKKREERAARKVDSEFYIPYKPSDQYTEQGLSLTDFKQDTSRIALDLVGDSTEMIHKQRQSVRKWDPAKKKYVQVTDDVKMVRSESGGLIRASYKSDRYKRWKDKNKISDDADDEEKISMLSNIPQRFRQNRTSDTRNNIVKDRDTILKQRKIKERRRERDGMSKEKRRQKQQAKKAKAKASKRGKFWLSLTDFKQDTSRIALDLVGDSTEMIHKQRQSVRKWDPAKKKYVQVTDDVKMVRSESGGLIRASYKSDRYKRWKDKNKISDDADDEEKISMLSNIPQRFRQNRTPDTRNNIVKDRDTILKQRKIKERRRER